MLNYLLNQEGLFAVGGKNQCTTGMDITDRPMRFAEMKQKLLRRSEESTVGDGDDLPAVAVVDVQGYGMEGGQYDMTLLATTLLMSKVTILNYLGQVPREELYRRLTLMAAIGNKIVRSEGYSVSDKLFGHLHIVCRDFHFKLNEEEETARLLEWASVKEPERDSKARTRNEARACFAGIHVHLLPFPSEVDVLNEHDSIPFDQLRPDFKVAMEKLAEKVVQNLREPHEVDGTSLTPGCLGSFLTTTVKYLQENEEVAVDDIVRTMYQRECIKAYELAKKVR